MKSGNAVFDLDKLQEHESAVEPADRFNFLVEAPKRFTKVPDAYGNLRVWREPERGLKYAIGADIAEGLEYGDYSCVQVLEAKSGEQVAVWHGHIDPDLFGSDVMSSLGWWYNTALVIPENNGGQGVAAIKELQQAGYPLIFRQRRTQDRNEKQTEMYGWRTTSSTKPFVMSELSAAIREDDLILHDAETIMELKTFVRDGKKMNGSPHDDRVMALALANEGRRWVYSEEYRVPEEKPGPGTIGYFIRQLDRAAKGNQPKKPKVGAFNGRGRW